MLGTSEAFYLPISTNSWLRQMLDVVVREGPIAEVALFRRMARAWNFGRTGSRIVNR